MVVPWELQFLIDPVPVLPVERKFLSITDEWLVLQSLSGTNNVKLMHIVRKAQQLHLGAAWGIMKGGDAEMSGIKIRKNTTSVYSNYLKRYVELNTQASYATMMEMSMLPTMTPGMSVLLWNAKGIAREGFKRNIRQLIKDHKPEIIILTEIKVSRSNCEELIESLPFNSFEVVDPIGLSGGILIMWNSGINKITTVTREPRAIHVVVQVNTKKTFFLSAIYASTSYNGRLEMWENLKILRNSVHIPWLVCGDFNEICFDHEKWGGNMHPLHQMRAYKETMDFCQLLDLGYVGHKFTWFNKQKRKPIFERLDRFWACADWASMFPHNIVKNLPRMSSDHNPLLLLLEKKKFIFPGIKPFRFEPIWLSGMDFIPFVIEKWPPNNDSL